MSADTKGPALAAPVAASVVETKPSTNLHNSPLGNKPAVVVSTGNSPVSSSSGNSHIKNSASPVNSQGAPSNVIVDKGPSSSGNASTNTSSTNTSSTNTSSTNTSATNTSATNTSATNTSATNTVPNHTPNTHTPGHNSSTSNSPSPGPGPTEGQTKESRGIFHSEPYVIGGFVEPPFVKPIHFSDIDQWKLPDRNYYVFICISFVLGFFGTDHFYLRSFGTGIQKLIFNIFSLGFWWWWDVLQIVTDSNKVKAEGLTTPFDWVRGVGRGVFEDPVKKAEALENGGKIVRVKKDIFVYALLTMLLGICGADKFYIGETNQGIAKLLSVFNIFTFLFGLAWVIWDSVNVLFYTESLMKNGISAPPPFSMLFPEPIKAGPLFTPEEVSKEQMENEKAQGGSVGGFPILGMDSFRFWYKELAVPMLQPTVGTAVKAADKSVKLGEKAAAVGGEVLSTGPKVASAVTGSIASAMNPTVIMEQVQKAAANKAAARLGVQAGGGSTGGGDGSSGPIVAGTLLAVVLAGAGKFVYDIVNKQ